MAISCKCNNSTVTSKGVKDMKYDFANIMLLIGSILVTLGLLLLLIDIILFGYNKQKLSLVLASCGIILTYLGWYLYLQLIRR
jgi:hypothetical protein